LDLGEQVLGNGPVGGFHLREEVREPIQFELPCDGLAHVAAERARTNTVAYLSGQLVRHRHADLASISTLTRSPLGPSPGSGPSRARTHGKDTTRGSNALGRRAGRGRSLRSGAALAMSMVPLRYERIFSCLGPRVVLCRPPGRD